MSHRNATLLLVIIMCSFTTYLTAQTSFTQLPFYHTVSHYSEPGSEAREHQINVERMVMDVRFAPAEGKVIGNVTHIATPLRDKVDSIVFDAIRITVTKAFFGITPVKFISTDSSVTVYLPIPWMFGRRDSIRFEYECTPRKGMYFIGWNDKTNRSRKQIWTQGQAFDNRHWCPMYDCHNDKMLTETIIRFDSDYKVLSNGTLRSTTKNNDGTTTWHYAMTKPHASYLVMIGIGKYGIEKRATKRGLPVNLWFYPEFPEHVQPTYQYSTEMIDFMEELLGVQFPWESYSQIPLQDYVFGAMENTTATTFGDFSLSDARSNIDRKYLNTNVHELTHQWFGDFITQRDVKSIWLHESFATFYPKLFQRKFFGNDVYQWMRRSEQNDAIRASEKDRLPIVHPNAGSTRIYPKGSAVLDMLMYVVGEQQFHRTITSYLKKHAYANVHTNDFYLAFQDELGMTLDWFFDEWLYRGGEPWYKVQYNDIVSSAGSRTTEFIVEQTHTTDELTLLFTMRIVFEVHYTDGTSSQIRQTVAKQQERIIVPNPQGKSIAFTLFDPGSYIIKKAEFKKSFAELKAQALGAPNMIDRYDAVRMLREDSTLTRRDVHSLLLDIFKIEKFHAIKSEIINAVDEDSTNEAKAILLAAATDRDHDVRKALVNTMKRVPEWLRPSFETMLGDSSYSVIETALTKLCEAYPSRASEYIRATSGIMGKFARVKIRNCELRAAGGDKQALDTLVDFSSGAFEFTTRQNAFNALKRLNYCSKDVVTNVVDAMLSQNGRLAGAATSLAEYFMQQSSYKMMFIEYKKSMSWKRWQERIVEKIAR
ncbi:MAG: M1 family metallopeptidase [Candidatus Kapabacteria bacterium]|nr:M1 family metallopeptidase [Candidatus Kapabacteria bacterium]